MSIYAKQNKNNLAWPLIFLCWLLYSGSYLGKVNYSANITQIIDFYGVTKTEAGAVPTFFFFAYGIGQVVNGMLCKKYNIKWVLFTSLTISSLINLIIAVSSEFAVIKWLWMINGFVMSMLWPTLIRLLAETLPQKDLGKSSIVMGTTVATGTLVIYALSSLYALFDNFKLAFYTPAFVNGIIAVIWLILYKPFVSMAKQGKKEEDMPVGTEEAKPQDTTQKKTQKKLLYASIYVLCFCAIGVNLVKDGLNTWVPSILKEEYGLSDSLSILLTLFLPIVAIFGNMFALTCHNKIPDYVTHCFVIFAMMCFFIGMIIGSLELKLVVLMLAGLIVVSFFAASLNSLITSIFPMFMRGKVNSGLYAGILNGFCYLGSTISSYGLGFIAEHFQWIAVFYVLIGFCVAVAVVWCGYKLYKRHIYIKEIEKV